MSIEEFNAASSAHLQRMCVAIVASLVTLFLCFAVFIPFRDTIHDFYTRQFGDAAAEVLMGMTPLPGVIVLFFG